MQAIHLFIVAAAASLLLTLFTLSNAIAAMPDASAPATEVPVACARPAASDSAYAAMAARPTVTNLCA